ncbi:MAG: primosomal protein N' [Epsilonproteobacteria bacterium]|nr:primosomal protein N' [Campylobacterota bacterium]
MPEITLTPQLEERFVLRFGDIISVFHSRLTPLQKFNRWLNVRTGRAPIVLGARSAIFVPAKTGIIVVDEEQDSSYKQSDMMPHYNGRDIAILRAKIEKIPVVLGSATPSVSTYYNAKIGKFRFFKIEKRVKETPLPKIYLADLNGRRTGIISEKLLAALEQKSQSLILVNRRGFAKNAVCLDCDSLIECPNCSVTLCYHKKNGQLKCHWCGYKQKVDMGCRKCGSSNLRFIGTGTERVETCIKEAFPDKIIERFDSDNTKKKGSYQKILNRLKDGEIDIIIGTQMLAKGHDYPGIMLSAILSYESLLAGADYLSSENAIQLALQVSGRAGRMSQGKSIIQTYNIHNPDFIDIIRHDYVSFCEKELIIRKRHLYPPFSHLIRMISINPKQAEGKKDMQYIASWLSDRNIEFLGPSECLISKIRNKFRSHLIIKTNNVKSSVRFLRNLVENKKFDSRIVMDVDAIDFF